MCQQSYGFLPCTTTVLGNLFLVLAYGFLMFKGAMYLSAGSELLLEILGPGLVGGLLLPILGALPEALIVLGSSIYCFCLPLEIRFCFQGHMTLSCIQTNMIHMRAYSRFV